MADDKPIAPRGAVRFDLLAMGDEDFESLCFRLVRLEFPDAVKPKNTGDEGADAVLPQPSGDRYARCWQAKHLRAPAVLAHTAPRRPAVSVWHTARRAEQL